MASTTSSLTDYGDFSNEEDILLEDPAHNFDQQPLPGPSITVNLPEITSPISTKRKAQSKRSWVWGTAESQNGIIRIVDGEQYWQCIRCEVRYAHKHRTHHPAQHLIKKHNLEEPENSKIKRLKQSINTIEASIERARLRAERDGKRWQEAEQEESERVAQTYPSLQPAAIEEAWVKLITQHDLPFTAPTWNESHTLFQLIRPEAAALLPQSATTVKSWVITCFLREQAMIKVLLSNVISRVHITLDAWSSPNSIAILGIVAHFTDGSGNLKRVLLGMRPLDGSHSGENMAMVVLQVADEYAIRHKLGYFMMDNASNNDTLLACIEQSQADISAPPFNATERRLRCNGHVINLSVKAFLFGTNQAALDHINHDDLPTVQGEMDTWRRLGPLGKAHNITIYTRKTPQRIAKFRELSGGIVIVRDNSTRWNSWADMLDCILRPEVRRAIRLYVDDNPELENDRLSPTDWSLLEDVQRVLLAFRIATKATEGHDATLGKVLPSIDYLLNTYSTALDQNASNAPLCSMIRIGWEKLDKYYSATSRAPVYSAVVVLHPRLKWRYFEARWKPQWVRNAKQSLKNYWNEQKSWLISQNPDAPASNLEILDDNPLNQWLDLHDLSPQLSGTASQTTQTSIEDEYDRYCRDIVPDRSIQNAQAYWLTPTIRREYPLLSSWAVDIQSIPAMSSEPERVFSGAKRMVSDLRHGLAVDGIEAVSCLKSWERAIQDTMDG